MRAKIEKIDRFIVRCFRRYGHWLHRVSLGLLFIWFGLLKPFGHKTTSSLLAHVVYWGRPDTIVLILGWWEVLIGICLIFRRLVRMAVALLLVRLVGVVLAFVLKADVCWEHYPLAPTPEGQYLIKDLVIFFATIAIAGMVREESTSNHYH